MNIAWLGFVSGLLGCTQEAPVSEQPMVVLVSIDTLRADHLSSYGYERKTSPFLDTLAESGTRFEYARSASPRTLPAHATMLTGQLPATHHIVDDLFLYHPARRFWQKNSKRRDGDWWCGVDDVCIQFIWV